jgi:hypothetical protein
VELDCKLTPPESVELCLLTPSRLPVSSLEVRWLFEEATRLRGTVPLVVPFSWQLSRASVLDSRRCWPEAQS